MRRLAVLAVLLALVAGAWIFRADLLALWQDLRSGDEQEMEVSPELADRAEAKLAALTEPDPPARVAITEAELQSLVAYRIAQSLPTFILSPTVRLEDGRVHVQARVPTDEVAGMRRIAGSSEILEMLPDTTDVEARGHLIPLGNGRVGLAVDEVAAAKIPLPDRVIPRLLESVGRVDEPGLPERALSVRLPTGATGAYVNRDSLVFISDGTAPPAAAD